MGICGSMVSSENNINTENDTDKIIILINAFMKDKLTKEDLKPFLSNLIYYQILSEKSDFVKSRRFNKWLEMSSLLKTFPFSNDITIIINSLKKSKETKEKNTQYEICYKKGTKELSYTELGLKLYYNKNRAKFESRIIKSPPGVYRWTAWMILTNISSSRSFVYYEQITSIKIKKKTHNKILNIIEDTIKEKCEKSNLIKSCLFRLLKSILILDPDIYYLKEICYILAYLTVISNFDEVNIFYMVISLLSFGNNNKHGLRGFFIKENILIEICIKLFEKNFVKFFPELSEHFNLIKFKYMSYIKNLMQLCYINFFSNFLVLRIWDYFLVRGISFLINLSLSIMEYFHEDLMNLPNEKEVLIFFKKLNPDIYNKYNSYNNNIIDIEEIISNADKKYKITNEDIFNELKKECPKYKLDYEYDYKNINEYKEYKGDKKDKDSFEEILSTIDRVDSLNSLNKKEQCYFRLNSLIKKGEIVLQENDVENIELSISGKNVFRESSNSLDNSFEEIEDENNFYLHEHIKDLIDRQGDSNFNSNYIK